jgi:hypothetical protein
MKDIILIFFLILSVPQFGHSQVQYLTLNPEDNNLPVTYFECKHSKECWGLNSALLLKCDSLVELKDTFFVEYGVKSKFRGYRIESPVALQTSCNAVSIAEMDTFNLTYDIYIASENNDAYLDLMIDSLYASLVSDKLQLESESTFSRSNYFLYNRGEFLFYNRSSYYLIHFNGFLIKVLSKEEKAPNQGWGALASFMEQVCDFRGDDYAIFFEGKAFPNIHPLDFIIWYEAGKFK